MLTVKEVSELAGISIRTLHYYDKIGLLPPSAVTEAGYRLYDEEALEKLMKKEHLENLILFAQGIRLVGWRRMDFTVFDTKKFDEYAQRTKEEWGRTDAYREFEKKSKDRSKTVNKVIEQGLMEIFIEFGRMMQLPPESDAVQRQVRALQEYITQHFYTCTKEILSGLGQMYAGGGEFTENIDNAAGKGCGEFVGKAIAIYCR